MASKKLIDFEKAIEYMDPLQVTDCLHKTLDFLKRNNSELYFPSISPYVEAFLVNLVSDTRNLMSESFKHENRKLASEIIEVLEMSRDVFRWTHSYENGNLLVYKKIFSNKMKKPKPSSIAHHLLQAQTQQSPQSPTIGQHAPVSIDQPDIPATSTSFKLRFLSKTLRFIKDDTEFTLYYKEMPLDLAEYICSLIKYRDKEVGFGYKSLYAPLWEAMERFSVDYKFEVLLEETSRDTAVLKLEKVPKHNKTKRDITKTEIPAIIHKNVNGQNGECRQKEEMSNNKSPKPKRDKQNQSLEQCLNITSQAFPQLELLSNIDERFFADVVVALTDFADDQARASIGFQQLAEQEITFVKRVKTLAESSKVREMFPPKYRDLLWRLDYSIKEVLQTFKITTTVNEEDRSITLKKTPRFPAPLSVTQQSVPTGARSKSLVSAKSRDRSMSKDRIIEFQSGGNLPATSDVEMSSDGPTTEDEPTTEKEQQERGRSRDGMSKRTAKLLEDLSTPIESDKGIRMMLLMGWNGGALGARGDGIMEPVMPNIEQPTRGGLGHVPPPKPAKPAKPPQPPRRPLHFRLTFLHGIYDLLLHDDMQKEIQLKEPLLGKETNFVQSALSCLNKRRGPALTAQESALVGLIVRELVGRPAVKLRHEFSSDFKTLILHKLTDQQMKTPKVKPVKKPEVVTITDDDVDVLITIDDVRSVMPHVDDGQTRGAAAQKANKKRAARLLVLTKFAEVLHWDWDGQSRIIFKFTFTLPKKLKLFIRTVVDSLNNDARHHSLLGWEAQVYRDLRQAVVGSMLTWEGLNGSKYALTITPLINEDILPDAGPHPNNINNNDNKTDNRNQIVNMNDCTKQNDNISIKVDYNDHGQRLVEAVVNTPSNIKDSIDINNEDDHLTLNTDDRNIFNTPNQEIDHCLSPGGISVTIQNNITKYITVKDVNRINAEFDELKIANLTQNERMEVAEVKIKTVCDIAEPSVEDNDKTMKCEVKNSGGTEEAKMEVHDITVLSDWDRDIQDLEEEVHDITVLSDWDRDIQDLEETILNVDLDCVVKEENAECDLEMAISETDLEKSVLKEENTDCDLEIAVTETDLDILKKEKDIDYLNAKRSHSSSVCSQELDPKKVKISCETDEHVVRITPKNLDEKMTEDLVKQVQNVMSNELDISGGFLPLLKCHGVQNGGLIYSCHDEDDVAWLKKVISVANLDLEIVPCNDLCTEKKTRELLIRINSYIPLDEKKIFSKFEIYNLGLDTKYWRVSHKHTDTTFVMLIVTVDEKSFEYISDEKFSLYCGIDKAQCSILY